MSGDLGAGRRYDPPGRLPDFKHIEGQSQQWSHAVSGWFDECIAYQEAHNLHPGDKCQYYNWLTTSPPGPDMAQTIVWNALPNTLVRRFGQAKAVELADRMFPLTERADGAGGYFTGKVWERTFYRPHDEYCEWRVIRNSSGKITKIVFTSEPPEYWQALHGDTLPGANEDSTAKYPFRGDRALMLELYRTYVDKNVQLKDLQAQQDLIDEATKRVVIPAGAYNPWNKWNTTHGAMHLCQPDNTLVAEIALGADATVLRRRGDRPVENPDELVCCSRYGGPMRNSDPTIGASVNSLARMGCWITLRNPVGLYIHHIDLAGITRPDGTSHGRPITPEYFRVERGSLTEQLIARAVFEVPPSEQPASGEPLTVSDLRIAGVPIEYGAQLAGRITVALTGVAAGPGSFRNTPVGCVGRCCQGQENPMFLRLVSRDAACPDGTRPAFDYPGAENAAPEARLVADTAPRLRHRA
ncbi:hypothetical protein [Nonomuraea sp. B19D2]|uniref:hypothetical protein n=1 Tax=Nonomuraea sp. B19D2 TaxID=3159561 RepID=UPI0032D9B9EE